MIGIQILILFFCFFAVARTFGQMRRRQLSILAAVLWILFWVAVAVVGLLPETSQWLANRLGVGRGADLVTYASLAALFYLVFRLFTKVEQVEQEVSRLVRKMALDQHRHE
jgi:hypothetical protein